MAGGKEGRKPRPQLFKNPRATDYGVTVKALFATCQPFGSMLLKSERVITKVPPEYVLFPVVTALIVTDVELVCDAAVHAESPQNLGGVLVVLPVLEKAPIVTLLTDAAPVLFMVNVILNVTFGEVLDGALASALYTDMIPVPLGGVP